MCDVNYRAFFMIFVVWVAKLNFQGYLNESVGIVLCCFIVICSRIISFVDTEMH